jgi:hypothetical protein
MRRWFQTPQWFCSVCSDWVDLTTLLGGKCVFYENGKVECPKCTLGGARLKWFMLYLSKSNITA